MKLSDIKVGEIYCAGISQWNKRRVKVTHIHMGGELPDGYEFWRKYAHYPDKTINKQVVCIDRLDVGQFEKVTDVVLPQEIIMLWSEWETEQKEKESREEEAHKREIKKRTDEKSRWKAISSILKKYEIDADTLSEYGGDHIRVSLDSIEKLCQEVSQ